MDELAGPDAEKKQWWRSPVRRNCPDFCSLFAADGLRDLEAYLASWAAYSDYLAERASEDATPLGARLRPA